MTDTSSAADYRDYLHRYGLKNTRHRQLILQLLLASEGVLTAEDIYQQLCEQGTEINFSTVYRILENFTQKGLTEKSIRFIIPMSLQKNMWMPVKQRMGRVR